MTRQAKDQFAKELLKSLLEPFGQVASQHEVPAEALYIDVAFAGPGPSIDPVELKGSYIPDPGTWTQVEVSAIGDSLRLKVGGQEVSRLARTPRRGPLALVFPAEVEAYVRNARIVLQ